MDTCKHNRVAIWETTKWVVDREKKEYDIHDEEFDPTIKLYCCDCGGYADESLRDGIIEIIEKGRGNE